MCIGVPARITAIRDGLMPMADLEVDGDVRTCCLAYVPEAEVGDYVIVANGFAMTVVSAEDAAASRETFAQLREAEGRR
ncbi:HypC/HybG/HupF family hydrogenase formation chaperone [Corynebacterium sp. 335C]